MRQELERRGHDFLLLVRRNAVPEIVKELRARAVLDEDPTFRLEWSFAERTRRFVELLHARVDRVVREDDVVMITIATQVEAHAAAHWLRSLRRKPFVVVTFLSDRWNRAGQEEHERQAAEFREVARTLATLSPDDANRMLFTAVTEPLAAELGQLLGTPFLFTPMLQRYGTLPVVERSAIPRAGILGGTRREKGSHRIPDVIRACRDVVAVEFVVQLTNDNLSVDDRSQLAAIAGLPGVVVLPDALPLEEYETTLARLDVLLFPYEEIPYRQRTSGVFGEAVAHGIPVVVTPGTWLAQQIEEGRAAGVVADDHSAEAMARAIARAVRELEALRGLAASLRDAWRKDVSITAYLDIIEAELARRKPPRPRRRWWW